MKFLLGSFSLDPQTTSPLFPIPWGRDGPVRYPVASQSGLCSQLKNLYSHAVLQSPLGVPVLLFLALWLLGPKMFCLVTNIGQSPRSGDLRLGWAGTSLGSEQEG